MSKRSFQLMHFVLGHKDYLFHRLLAQQLVYTSFRLDFRGNGESTGQPGYANMEVWAYKKSVWE
jgi:hypothetical protein